MLHDHVNISVKADLFDGVVHDVVHDNTDRKYCNVDSPEYLTRSMFRSSEENSFAPKDFSGCQVSFTNRDIASDEIIIYAEILPYCCY